MIQLCYVSNASEEVDSGVVEDILNFARAENRLVNITGLLLFNGKRFLQILEGDEENVTNVYNRIKRDRRHSHVIKVASRRIAEREFGAWDMAFERMPSENGSQYLNEKVGRLTSAASPSVRALFHSFAAL